MSKSYRLAPLVALISGLVVVGASAAEARSCHIDRYLGQPPKITAQEQDLAVDIGAALPNDAEIETGPNARTVVRCDDGTTITLGPETTVALIGLVGPAGRDRNVLVRLVQGIAGIVAPNRTWDRFEVETSLAIASVRSTEWLVESDAVAGTAVFVAVGRVEVRTGGAVFQLAPGEGVSVPGPQTGASPGPIDVMRWGAARIARSRAALGFGWE